MALFIAIAAFQFIDGWPQAERGLLSFEKACAIHSAHGALY
jgi:hypothetical protein